jgi:protein-disulfide isomerase
MKYSHFLSLGLISATLSAFAAMPVPQASAQCVMNDTNIQLSMNGSGKKAEQSSDVKQASNGGCVGNTINTTNVQTQTGGTDRAVQRRQSSQQINGSNNSPTGINMEPVKVNTNVQVDVDNPADRLGK